MVDSSEGTTPKKRGSRDLTGIISPLQFVVGVSLALIAGAIILLIFREDPIKVYDALLQGALGSKRTFAETLLSSTPLIFGGLAVAVGFRCGLFNMGVEGQIVLGGLVAAYIGYAWPLPPGIHLLVALLGGTIIGAFWGAIPGYLKAFHRIHEVITTIMLNYIAFAIASYMVAVGGPMKAEGQLPTSPKILESAMLQRILPGTRLSSGIFIALFVTVLIYFFLFQTRLGYKLRVVGFNAEAAEFAGISSKFMTIFAMFISGGLGGIAGAVEVLGVHYRFYENFSPGYGWDAIAVALLGLLHPVGVVAAALLLGALRSGSVAMQALANISKDMVYILTALIIFFTAMNQTMRPFLERRLSRLNLRSSSEAAPSQDELQEQAR
ncbi:MAG TPA: ABC transporter permease [Anaerolineales bacterium]|nr:ABC transporter permease [Anaerolineales bacterium]